MSKANFARVDSYNIDLILIYIKKVKIDWKNEALIEIIVFKRDRCTYWLIYLPNK